MSQLQSEMEAEYQRLAFRYAALQASHTRLVDALEECVDGGYLNRYPEQKSRISNVIANAAKLDPIRVDGKQAQS